MLKNLFRTSGTNTTPDFKELSHADQLQEIDKLSNSVPVVLYKHSTACNVSSMAFDRLQRGWDLKPEEANLYFLDLLQHRDLSNLIAKHYGVQHESPQILIIKSGKSVFDTSHFDISVSRIKEAI